MSNTYTWKIEALDTFPSFEGQQNVVYIIHWRLYGSRYTESGSYESNIFGTQQVAPYISGSPFIPFQDLTQENVTGWLLDAMGPKYGELTASLNQTIENMINPPIITLPPPWPS